MNKNTASHPFFLALEKTIVAQHSTIESWFQEQWQSLPPPLTCSVDLRNGGFKLSSVDANLFPAGFNNLSPDFFSFYALAFQNVLSERHPQCKNILIVPENHTRNQYYYQSVAALQAILEQAGYRVCIASSMLNAPHTLTLPNHEKLILYPLIRKGDCLMAEDQFMPCMILLNNDLSDSLPPYLIGISQPIEPCPQLGWHTRTKSIHFHFYQTVCETFSHLVNIDPWSIAPLYMDVGKIDFQEPDDINTLIQQSTLLFSNIQKKYDQYNIPFSPFVILKPQMGTYGKGVLSIHSPDDLYHLNRKKRHNLSKTILLQEGIPSIETFGKLNATAEPVVYLCGQHVMGGFYRFHPNKGKEESLNSPGMQFYPLHFSHHFDVSSPFYLYSIIARLASLATSYEKRYYCEKT